MFIVATIKKLSGNYVKSWNSCIVSVRYISDCKNTECHLEGALRRRFCRHIDSRTCNIDSELCIVSTKEAFWQIVLFRSIRFVTVDDRESQVRYGRPITLCSVISIGALNGGIIRLSLAPSSCARHRTSLSGVVVLLLGFDEWTDDGSIGTFISAVKLEIIESARHVMNNAVAFARPLMIFIVLYSQPQTFVWSINTLHQR